jgi:hypothetical protein
MNMRLQMQVQRRGVGDRLSGVDFVRVQVVGKVLGQEHVLCTSRSGRAVVGLGEGGI